MIFSYFFPVGRLFIFPRLVAPAGFPSAVGVGTAGVALGLVPELRGRAPVGAFGACGACSGFSLGTWHYIELVSLHA